MIVAYAAYINHNIVAEPVITLSNDVVDKVSDYVLESIKLLISMSTLALGACGFFSFKVELKSSAVFKYLVVTSSIFAASSILFSFSTLIYSIALLEKNSFRFSSNIIQSPLTAAYYLCVISVLMLAVTTIFHMQSRLKD